MKTGIHPQWQHDCVVTCSCGNSFTTGSTQPVLHVDICSKCHPFFTGEQRFVDRQGRVDRFLEKMRKAEALKKAQSEQPKVKAESKQEEPESYKDILRKQQTVLKRAVKSKADTAKKAETSAKSADAKKPEAAAEK